VTQSRSSTSRKQMVSRYLVSSDGHCLCDDRTEGTVTFSKQEAKDIVKYLKKKGIESQIIEVKVKKWLSMMWN